jgi:hypothetical protein
LELAATNDDHFSVPGGVTHPRRPGSPALFGSAILAYRHYHQVALEQACRLGRSGGDLSQAMAREAAAQHFLTDAITAGHMRTPVAQIRRFWRSRYPAFWESLQRRVASDTASTLRELVGPLRRLPAGFLHDATLSALTRRTSRYPPLSMGDFLARLFHDWDNSHGLAIEAGGVVFGDGYIHYGVTRELALAAVRAGIDDVEVAFKLGAAGGRLSGERCIARCAPPRVPRRTRSWPRRRSRGRQPLTRPRTGELQTSKPCGTPRSWAAREQPLATR